MYILSMTVNFLSNRCLNVDTCTHKAHIESPLYSISFSKFRFTNSLPSPSLFRKLLENYQVSLKKKLKTILLNWSCSTLCLEKKLSNSKSFPRSNWKNCLPTRHPKRNIKWTLNLQNCNQSLQRTLRLKKYSSSNFIY